LHVHIVFITKRHFLKKTFFLSIVSEEVIVNKIVVEGNLRSFVAGFT